MLEKILIANDGSEAAFRALALALDMAQRRGAEVHMVSVAEIPWAPGTREEMIGEKELADHKLADVIERAKAEASDQGVRLGAHLLAGHPVKAITGFAGEKGFDALVIGHVGHSQVYNMLIGGNAERLVRLAPCTVIVVK
ncbi:MAG: universal stress protein [Paracoccaceae bacterium]